MWLVLAIAKPRCQCSRLAVPRYPAAVTRTGTRTGRGAGGQPLRQARLTGWPSRSTKIATDSLSALCLWINLPSVCGPSSSAGKLAMRAACAGIECFEQQSAEGRSSCITKELQLKLQSLVSCLPQWPAGEGPLSARAATRNSNFLSQCANRTSESCWQHWPSRPTRLG